LLWATTFISLGYFLGERWEAVSKRLHYHFGIATGICALIALAYLLFRWRRRDRSPGPPST